MTAETIVLASGGIESATLLCMEINQGAVKPVFVDYGQRAASPERQALEAQCRELGLTLRPVPMPGAGEVFRSEQTWQHHVPLPRRNLVLLALATSYAVQRHADRVCIGVTRDDVEADPTADPHFIESYAWLAGRISAVRVEAPLIERRKHEVVSLGARLGVDFTHTYSCLLGYESPCGQCPQCRKRAHAFAQAGISDPSYTGSL